MSSGRGDGRLSLGGKAHDNLHEYMSGMLAAIRTHQRLTSNSPLRVEIEDRARIPLAQAILLR